MDFGEGEPEVVGVGWVVGADDVKGDLEFFEGGVEAAFGGLELGDSVFTEGAGIHGFDADAFVDFLGEWIELFDGLVMFGVMDGAEVVHLDEGGVASGDFTVVDFIGEGVGDFGFPLPDGADAGCPAAGGWFLVGEVGVVPERGVGGVFAAEYGDDFVFEDEFAGLFEGLDHRDCWLGLGGVVSRWGFLNCE